MYYEKEATNRTYGDDNLSKFLKSEIKSNRLFLEKMIPSDFPFTILDDDVLRGKRKIEVRELSDPYNSHTEDTITFTRQMDEDKIYVSVEKVNSRGDDSNEDKEYSGADYLTSLKMHVKIIRQDWKKLTFVVNASANEINIESISVHLPPVDLYGYYSTPSTYTMDKDGNLQCGLREYLKTIGINKTTTDFLYEYMVSKPNRKHPMLLLENLYKFLKN